jgi:2-polyprenyl-6-methoxyphenol hydroxylase-like FAD-dependent oxidoreductase
MPTILSFFSAVNNALASNAVKVFQHISVYHALRAQGRTYEKLALPNSRRQELGSLFHRSEKHYNYAALRVHRVKVQMALLEKAQAQAQAQAQGAEVYFGMKLTDLREGGIGVELIFTNGQTTEADFVVDADGVYSKVRPRIIKRTRLQRVHGHHQHEYRQAYALGVRSGNPPSLRYGQTGFVAMMPTNVPANRIRFLPIPAPARSRMEWEDLGSDPDELQKIVRVRFGQN